MRRVNPYHMPTANGEDNSRVRFLNNLLSLQLKPRIEEIKERSQEVVDEEEEEGDEDDYYDEEDAESEEWKTVRSPVLAVPPSGVVASPMASMAR